MPGKSLITNLNADDARRALKALANPSKAKILSSFFKTGPGQYGHGDVFLGVTVPHNRSVAKKFAQLNLNEILDLLTSKIHEERLLALLIWIDQFQKGHTSQQKTIYELYLKNTRHINNWDLVDLSAPRIVGAYLFDKNRKILFKLVRSAVLWERRIAILATQYFIKHNDFNDTLQLAEQLLTDQHDLIHKAVGWMLREVGQRNLLKEEEFLQRYYLHMPRTMLRYAIEHLDEKKRKSYLTGTL